MKKPLHRYLACALAVTLLVATLLTGWMLPTTAAITPNPGEVDVYDCEFTVKFFDEDGVTQLGLDQNVPYQAAAVAPTAPAHTGKTFDHWDTDFSCVEADLNVTAVYTLNEYTVTFRDWDNHVLKKETVLYGAAVEAPEDPSRFGYTFAGWSRTDFNAVTTNMLVTPIYTQNTYTVTFKGLNDVTIATREGLHYGDAAVAPEMEATVNDGGTLKYFIRWDVDFSNITDNLTVNAVYDTCNHQYTDTIVEATAQEDGYTRHTCSECGTHYDDQFTEYVAPTTPQITVQKRRAHTTDNGSTAKKIVRRRTVTVDVNVANNPGIIGMRFKVGYDASKITLLDAAAVDFPTVALGKPELANGAFYIAWSNATAGNSTQNGIIARLTFQVAEDAPLGDVAITVSYDESDIFDEEFANVYFATVKGFIRVIDYAIGDCNHMNNTFNTTTVIANDATLLLKYYNTPDQLTTLEQSRWLEEAADINFDGKVNMTDYAALLQLTKSLIDGSTFI